MTIEAVLVESALYRQKRSRLVRESTINDFVTILIWRWKRKCKVSYKEIVISLINCSYLDLNVGGALAKSAEMVLS